MMQNLNAETFINKWWSSLSSPLSLDLEGWMGKSYSDPETFWKSVIYNLQEQILPAPQSIFGKSYDFYHDCIVRHIKSNNIAYSILKENDYAENWTYEKLHHCVNFHVDKWSYHTPQQGQVIAIVAAPGIHFVISLLTALRFGLKICYLPTNSPFLGKGQIIKFLSVIKPHLIATEDISFSIEGVPLLSVNENGVDEENHAPQSYAYPATSHLQFSLSLQHQEALAFVTLGAHTTYLHSLQDALLTLNLIQHSYWASPLSCPIRTEPCSTFMSLLCGVTRVHVPDEAIRKNPSILQNGRVNLIGITSSLQQLWNQVSGVPTRYLKSFYKSPLDTNHHSWKTFVQLNRMEKIPIFDLIMDNSSGGVPLFSRPTLETFNFFLKPTLGTSWSLNNLNDSGVKSLNGFGIFNTHLPSSERNLEKGNFTAIQVENNLMLTGFVKPCREGVTFPIIELEQVVNNLSFVEVCIIHPIQKTGAMFSNYFVLLVFVNPMKSEISNEDKDHWSAEISQNIVASLGSGFLPDHIEYFPLLPKTNAFGIDRAWCANQYDSGLLIQKKSISKYQILSVLKKLAHKMANSEAERT